ncbi:hypothetical protein [Pseudonocardia spinosispora]|uniref:hypothetical protein n=1 Tax=Pseudonocardia spinosispora TaxID=103441 RepID=UPI0003F5B62C|nr:hypothetical protein [Pseudonocardia spinosispora]
MDQVFFIDEQASHIMIELDRAFEDRFAAVGAVRQKLPPLLPAAPLRAIDYYQNFHHLANMVGVLDGPEFDRPTLRNGGLVVPSAACYGVYLQHRGSVLNGRKLITSNVDCARLESTYEPLVRLGSYSVRELVVLGAVDDARDFFAALRQSVIDFAATVELPLTLEAATDSFFQSDSPKAVLQKLSKSKLELVYDGRLAVGSINFHRNFFGERFDIALGAEPAFTACFGAGLERWAYMLRDHAAQRARCDQLLDRACTAIGQWAVAHA